MKLKIKNLNRIIEELSGREIDFFLYLIKRQSSIGCVDGVYYRDVLEDLYMPRSTFYVVLDSLQKKGFIKVDWFNHRREFNIVIIDNAFLNNEDYKEGYVNINLDFILSKEFISLGVNLKKFFLRLLGLQANAKSVKLLKDTLKKYKVHKLIDELRIMFNIVPDGDGYYFTIKLRCLRKSHNDDYLRYQNKLKNYCEEYDIDYTDQEMKDSVTTIINNIRKRRMSFIHKALDSIRKKGRLQPKLITHICKQKRWQPKLITHI